MGYLGHSSGTLGAMYSWYQRAQREYSETQRVLSGTEVLALALLLTFLGFVNGVSVLVHLCISARVCSLRALVCATGLCIARRRPHMRAQANADVSRQTRRHAHVQKAMHTSGTRTHSTQAWCERLRSDAIAESDVAAADAFPDVANGAVRDRNSRPCGCATIRSCVRS